MKRKKAKKMVPRLKENKQRIDARGESQKNDLYEKRTYKNALLKTNERKKQTEGRRESSKQKIKRKKRNIATEKIQKIDAQEKVRKMIHDKRKDAK